MKTISIPILFSNWNKIFQSQVDYLTYLDGVAGDGDLGIVMKDGFQAIESFVMENPQKDLGKLFYLVGKQFNRAAPSSMGSLLSAGFMNVGKRLKGVVELEQIHIVDILGGMVEGVTNVGKALEGEKTFLDAMFPAARAVQDHINEPFDQMMQAVQKAADEGVERATDLVAKHGRIAFRGEASKGIIDPGSVVATLLVKGIAEV